MTLIDTVTTSATRLAAALALCAGACAPAHAAGDAPVLELALVARATVDGDRVLLRDVVTVVRDDDGVAHRVLSFDLGPSPRVGQIAHLQESQVEDWIRGQRPAAALDIRWRGADSVVLRRASQVVANDDIDRLAQRELEGWLASRSDTHVVDAAPVEQVVEVPTGPVSLAVRPLPRVGEPSSRMSVWVDVAVDGRFQRAVEVPFQVQALRRAWVARDDLAAGQDLDASRVVQASVDVARVAETPWTDLPERSRMRRAVHRGDALTTLDVEVRPAVVRGERVAVFSGVGDLSVETTAEALQDGHAGQDVLVRIATSREPVTARVLKPGLVEVRP